MQSKNLFRSKTNRVFLGVCGGLGEYFGIDPIVFRIIFLALTFGAGSGVILYLAAAILMPESENSNSDIDLKQRVQSLVSEVKDYKPSSKNNYWLGLVIVIIGTMLLLDQFLPIRFISGGMVWGVIIVIMGILIMVKPKNISIKKIKEDESRAPKEDKKETVKQKQYYRRNNGCGSVLFGAFLVFLGLMFLAQNIGFSFEFNFEYLFRYWPIFIIIAGLSVVFRGTWLAWLSSLLFSLFIIVLIVFSIFWKTEGLEIKRYEIDYGKEQNIKRSEITIKTNASTTKLSGGSEKLISGLMESNMQSLEKEKDIIGDTEKISLEMKGKYRFGYKVINKLDLELSDSIPLDLNLESNASTYRADLSDVVLENLNLDVNASTFDIVFGDKAKTLNSKIEANASTLNIFLPKTVGIRIRIETNLSTKQISGLKEIEKGVYQSDDYEKSEKKIELEIKSNVSTVNVI